MSSKDDFFKKMEDRKSEEQQAAERLKKDIAHFQNETSALFELIQHFFEGSVVKSELRSVDLSVENKPQEKYSINSLRLNNNSKMLSFVPDSLYGMGYMGSIKVKLHTQGSTKDLFYLHMSDKRCNFDGWAIIKAEGALKIDSFNEENFFSLIGGFA